MAALMQSTTGSSGLHLYVQAVMIELNIVDYGNFRYSQEWMNELALLHF